MDSDSKRKLQITLLLGVVLTAARTGYILYERHADSVAEAKPKPAPPPLNPDYYVTPKKLRPYDLKSAQDLTQQPVWVKLGYSSTYYPYDSARRRTNFSHEAGKLQPIEKLEIKKVVLDLTPKVPDQQQMMALFEKDGKTYAFPIGTKKDDDYHIYSDDMLFIQDPHDLYKHWSADVWQSIDKHEVKPGMNELQVSFAVGFGVPEDAGDLDKTVDYANGGNPLTVTYRNGKVAEVKPGT